MGGQTLIEGARCVGQNDVSIGIENEGNYFDVDPPDALYESLIGLCAFICQQYGNAPDRDIRAPGLHNTQCPDRLEDRSPDLRNQVAALL